MFIMKKKLMIGTLSIVLMLGLFGCASGETVVDDIVENVGSDIEIVETMAESEEPETESVEEQTSDVVSNPVDDVTRVGLLHILGWGDEIADKMTQEEAIMELREHAGIGGGAWQSAEDAQEKGVLVTVYREDGSGYMELHYTYETILDNIAFEMTVTNKEKIKKIYINDVLVDADWTTVEVVGGDYIILDMRSNANADANTEEASSEDAQSEDNTNPAFYNWVSKENEASDIAWFVENYNVSEEELRTWNEEQWQAAFQTWNDSFNTYTPSNNDIDESKIIEIEPGVYEYDNFDEINAEELDLPVPELSGDAPAGYM